MSNFYGRRGSKSVSLEGGDASEVDYKDLQTLMKFVTEVGKMVPRRITGVGAKSQRRLTHAIKLARYLALLPYCDSHR